MSNWGSSSGWGCGSNSQTTSMWDNEMAWSLEDDSQEQLVSRFVTEMVDGQKRRRCTYVGCNKSYSHAGSTNALRRHLSVAHGLSQPAPKTVFTFSDDAATDAIIKMVVIEQLEYSFIEKKSFLNAMRHGGPDKTFISRTALSDTIISKTEEIKASVIALLENVVSIALTFDIWSTQNSSAGYGCVTGHFFDSSITLQSTILEFKHIPFPHDAKTICSFLFDVVTSFNIEKKIIAITTDSASNNIAGIAEFRELLNLNANFNIGFLHFRCVAHIIHNAVKKSLDKLSPFIGYIRSIISTIRGSIKRTERFNQITTDYILENPDGPLTAPLKLKLDMDIRLNSTFIMLERAVQLEGPINRAKVLIPELCDGQQVDWLRLKELLQFLRPFHDVTEQLSGSKYATISLINTSVPKLIKHLQHQPLSDSILQNAADALSTQLNAYSEHLTQDLVYLSTVLDPRIKLHTIPIEAHSFVRQLLQDNLDKDDLSSISTDSQSNNNPSFFNDIFVDSGPNELDFYLNSPRETFHCNTLEYWRYNSSNLPNLSKLARTILPIQATSVASERAFSSAGELDTIKRNRLSHESFRANMLLKSWLKLLNLLDFE